MLHRASQTVFWRGYTADIEKSRAGCHMCNTIAPSQQQVPVQPSPPPTTPFESIAADFFDLAGVHYLVTVDTLRLVGRYSRSLGHSRLRRQRSHRMSTAPLRRQRSAGDPVFGRGDRIHIGGNASIPQNVASQAQTIIGPLPTIERASRGRR